MTAPPTRTHDEAHALLGEQLELIGERREQLGEEGAYEVAGWRLQMAMEWEASALAYARCFELNDRSVQALFGRGVCALELSRWDEAADLFRRALELDDALEADEGAERLDWFDEDPAYRLGNALHAKGDLDAACEAYAESARRNASGVEALRELVRCEIVRGRGPEALDAVNRMERRAVRLTLRAEVQVLRAEAEALL